jgi:dTDP-3-amino-3,4,6-trideoxy-alpha-D-glucose transaminase
MPMPERHVPFLCLDASEPEIAEALITASRRVLESGRFVLGEEVDGFESAWADWTGAHHAVGVGSGLDALTLSLQALGIGPGDDVLVPSNTFIATWLAVSAVGANPVPVEPDPGTLLIEPDAARAAITARTTAIVPVHLYGAPVDIDGFELLASKAGLALVFDAAQAHGARSGGSMIGGRGSASAWSFYPTKNLGALGDAGAVTTNDAEVARRIRILRDYGRQSRDIFAEHGRNSRLDEIQAAFLLAKLPRLQAWNDRRALLARRYLDALAGFSGQMPVVNDRDVGAWHLFVIRFTERAALAEHLRRLGVETLVHYPVPPHRQPAYAQLAETLPPLPIAEDSASSVLSIPLSPHLANDEQDWVIDALLSFSAASPVETGEVSTGQPDPGCPPALPRPATSS